MSSFVREGERPQRLGNYMKGVDGKYVWVHGPGGYVNKTDGSGGIGWVPGPGEYVESTSGPLKLVWASKYSQHVEKENSYPSVP